MIRVFSARARLGRSGPVVGTHGIPKSDARDLATSPQKQRENKAYCGCTYSQGEVGRLYLLVDCAWHAARLRERECPLLFRPAPRTCLFQTTHYRCETMVVFQENDAQYTPFI